MNGYIDFGNFVKSKTGHYHAVGIARDCDKVVNDHSMITSRVVGLVIDGNKLIVKTEHSTYIMPMDTMMANKDTIYDIIESCDGHDLS